MCRLPIARVALQHVEIVRLRHLESLRRWYSSARKKKPFHLVCILTGCPVPEQGLNCGYLRLSKDQVRSRAQQTVLVPCAILRQGGYQVDSRLGKHRVGWLEHLDGEVRQSVEMLCCGFSISSRDGLLPQMIMEIRLLGCRERALSKSPGSPRWM